LPGVFCRDFSLGFWRDPWDCFVDAKLHRPFANPFPAGAPLIQEDVRMETSQRQGYPRSHYHAKLTSTYNS